MCAFFGRTSDRTTLAWPDHIERFLKLLLHIDAASLAIARYRRGAVSDIAIDAPIRASMSDACTTTTPCTLVHGANERSSFMIIFSTSKRLSIVFAIAHTLCQNPAECGVKNGPCRDDRPFQRILSHMASVPVR
jgi:hypothetical protein